MSIEDEKERAAKRAEQREKRESRIREEAGNIKTLRGQYHKIKDDPAFADLVAKIAAFASYHVKVAKDGVAYEERKTAKGASEQSLVRLTNDQKLEHLQRAAGIEEISDYIERQLMVK